MFKKITFPFLVLLMTITLSACSLWQKKPPVEEPSEDPIIIEDENGDDNDVSFVETGDIVSLNKFNSYQEFYDFVSSQENFDIFYGDMMATQRMSDQLGSPVAESSQKAYGDDFSETNIQVEGVDEADIVKTDGKYIYFLVNRTIFIANAYPVNDLEIVYQLNLDSRPSELYLHEEKLIVLGSDHSINRQDINRPYSNFTFVKVYDISNPSQVNEIKDLSFEGYYNSSRLINGHLYLILNNNIRRYNQVNDLVPILIEDGQVLPKDCDLSSNCFSPDIYYFDSMYDSYNLSSINTIDLNNQVEVLDSQSYLISNNQTIYVSLNNIYISFPHYNRSIETFITDMLTEFIYDSLSEEEKYLVDEIYEISDQILNEQEKMFKLHEIYERNLEDDQEVEEEFQKYLLDNSLKISDEMEKTSVFRFSIENIIPEYQADGFVPGNVLNQFSMDEDNKGNLRVSTTKYNWFLRQIGFDLDLDPDFYLSYSNIFVLSPNLEIIGSARNIAPDERIYSTRFMGNRVYIVTFKEIDPFFVIDLEDPRNPQVLGELKIPGFSTYLHPYDENTIIGLGYDTSLSQWGNVVTEGVKLALFDVSDPENPIELDNFIAGETGSQSFALYNHKAFLFSYDKNLLLLPVFLRDYEIDGQKTNFAGALVFSIDDGNFNLRGKINHSEDDVSENINPWCGHNCYNNTVQRGLYIDDIIYTFSNNLLKANNLDNLELINQIKLHNYIEEEYNVIPMPRMVP